MKAALALGFVMIALGLLLSVLRLSGGPKVNSDVSTIGLMAAGQNSYSFASISPVFITAGILVIIAAFAVSRRKK
ncbi:MAG: hypothetical protein HY367_00875 [Candidatus Aenigmarchaeota archaeon]|nr:hypothetical protein [Candidatus Aenigmarchaeota archaeon]